MRAERGLLFVETRSTGVVIGGFAENVHDRVANLAVDLDEVYWLAAVALPAALAALPSEVPSEPSEKVKGNGQIRGQTTIDEMLQS